MELLARYRPQENDGVAWHVPRSEDGVAHCRLLLSLPGLSSSGLSATATAINVVHRRQNETPSKTKVWNNLEWIIVFGGD
jgi:hypothetical protein